MCGDDDALAGLHVLLDDILEIRNDSLDCCLEALRQRGIENIAQRSREEKLLYLLKQTGEEYLSAKEEYEKQLKLYNSDAINSTRDKLMETQQKNKDLEEQIRNLEAQIDTLKAEQLLYQRILALPSLRSRTSIR